MDLLSDAINVRILIIILDVKMIRSFAFCLTELFIRSDLTDTTGKNPL